MSKATRFALAGITACAATFARAEVQHDWYLEAVTSYVSASSPLDSWPSDGVGKLRRGENDDGAAVSRLFVEYHGRLTPTWHATVIADYVDDADAGVDIAEAYLDWRPIPKAPNRHQLRIGAFYPPLSLENGARGWQSPFTFSFSAINTWLGEEIRPIGAEWSMRRRLGATGAAQIKTFAAAFYGNDPAATLLFWRGWSLHDRQTRLNDRFAIPDAPLYDQSGTVVGLLPQTVEPIDELDDRPGFYAGLEWRLANRLLVNVARYDNRADPYAYGNAQWGWETTFDHVGLQVDLPRNMGLVAQWMSGSTLWVGGARSDGTLSPSARLMKDDFSSSFILLTGLVRGAHRLSLRFDDFLIERDEPAPALVADDGHAWTVAYRFEPERRLGVGLEWLEIESRRDLWPAFYGQPAQTSERALQIGVTLNLAAAKP